MKRKQINSFVMSLICLSLRFGKGLKLWDPTRVRLRFWLFSPGLQTTQIAQARPIRCSKNIFIINNRKIRENCMFTCITYVFILRNENEIHTYVILISYWSTNVTNTRFILEWRDVIELQNGGACFRILISHLLRIWFHNIIYYSMYVCG